MGTARFETFLEGFPLRGYVRERFEVLRLRALTEIGAIPRALHITCGNGEATGLILKHFAVGRMIGVDRDGAAIEAARRGLGSETLAFEVQEGAALPFPDSSFDAVFDLADIHNYADWKAAIAEIERILKPKGLLILEELSIETFSHGAGRFFKKLTDHPYESMFTSAEFATHLEARGFAIECLRRLNPLGLLRYFIIVARKG